MLPSMNPAFRDAQRGTAPEICAKYDLDSINAPSICDAAAAVAGNECV